MSDVGQVGFGMAIEDQFGYRQGRIAGGLLHIAGQVGRVPGRHDIPTRLGQAMERVAAVLDLAGRRWDDLVCVQSHVVAHRVDDWDDLLSRHHAHLHAARPATTLVPVSDLNTPDFLVEVSAIAADGGRSAVSSGGPFERAIGASGAVRVGPHVYVSGQMALTEAGVPEPAGDVVGQLAGALRAFASRLGEVGARMQDVVATHLFLMEHPTPAQFQEICAVHRAAWPGALCPTATMVYVPRLPVDGALVQVTGVAIVDEAHA